MILFTETPSKESVLLVIKDWLNALCREDYGAALGMLCNDLESWTEADMRVLWKAGDLKEIIEDYGGSKSTRVSSFEETHGGTPRHDVDFVEDPSQPDLVGEVWYDMPINGTWSDLTATFALRRRKGGVALELIDMHVM